MNKNILNGYWIKVNNEEEYNKLFENDESCNRKNCMFNGPGLYYSLVYMKRCERGCCSVFRIEVLNEFDAIKKLRELAEAINKKIDYRLEL